jgi:hypothetical protein
MDKNCTYARLLISCVAEDDNVMMVMMMMMTTTTKTTTAIITVENKGLKISGDNTKTIFTDFLQKKKPY